MYMTYPRLNHPHATTPHSLRVLKHVNLAAFLTIVNQLVDGHVGTRSADTGATVHNQRCFVAAAAAAVFHVLFDETPHFEERSTVWRRAEVTPVSEVVLCDAAGRR